MKHATAETIKSLNTLLEKIREIPGLQEKKPGVFYFKSQAFLHFHEDPTGIYADYKLNGKWVRQKVVTPPEWEELLEALHRSQNR